MQLRPVTTALCTQLADRRNEQVNVTPAPEGDPDEEQQLVHERLCVLYLRVLFELSPLMPSSRRSCLAWLMAGASKFPGV